MMAISGVGAVFGILYVLVVLAVAVLSIWALVLVIVFLRLRIAELRSAAGTGGTADPLG
ncbi:MAG: hypothetical protein ABS910_03015 [Arthrobacter sp.]